MSVVCCMQSHTNSVKHEIYPVFIKGDKANRASVFWHFSLSLIMNWSPFKGRILGSADRLDQIREVAPTLGFRYCC